MTASTPLLSLKGITKVFPGVHALENVQLDLWPGKVTALIGENGAGKSTLVKVMTGIYQPEEGEILYKAIPIQLPNPESAHKVGITAIHQETVLFDELSVTENIFVGQYLYKGWLKKLDWPAMHQKAREILTRLDVENNFAELDAIELHTVEWDGSYLYIQDMGSTNGTVLNGTNLKPDTWSRVKNGAVLHMGSFDYQVALNPEK